MDTSPSTGTLETTDTGTTLGESRKVILYNDDSHSMQEVVSQISKATGYAKPKAEQIMMEAHSKGRAVVIATHLERCEHVAAILEEIGLRTDIE